MEMNTQALLVKGFIKPSELFAGEYEFTALGRSVLNDDSTLFTNEGETVHMTTNQANYTDDEILFKGMDDIQIFPYFLTEVSGIKKDSDDYKFITAAIQTQSDLEKFGEVFDGDFGKMKLNTEKYLETLVH